MLFTEINKQAGERLPFMLATVGYSSRQIAIDRPCGFPYHEFLWVTEGAGKFVINGKALTLSAGQGVFLRDFVPRSYRSECFSTMWLTFRCDAGLLEAAGVGDYLVFDTPSALNEGALRLCERVARGSTMLERSGMGYRLVCEALEAITRPTLSPMERAARYLESNLCRPVTLDEVAGAAGLDRYALCRAFKKAYGCTVMDYVRRLRMQNAAELLRLSELPVAAIGRQCGYDSPGYFAATFRREMGSGPAQYRKNCRNL